LFYFGLILVCVCVQIVLSCYIMLAMVGGGLEAELLVEYNGQKFRHNDLVHVIVGTGSGVRGLKAEPLKARFKGVVETVRGPEFLCRPLVESSRGVGDLVRSIHDIASSNSVHLEHVYWAPESPAIFQS
jgi:hypothetical protein